MSRIKTRKSPTNPRRAKLQAAAVWNDTMARQESTPIWTLQTLLEGVKTLAVLDAQECFIRRVCDDSRAAKPGDLFVAVPGARQDGAYFAADAVSRGAVAVVTAGKLDTIPGVPQILVTDARKALGQIASAFHGHPTRAMTIAGVTGTNGKTTTSFLMQSILEEAHGQCGLIGTVKYQTGVRECSANNTTPGALALQEMFAEMVRAGHGAASMEVSSHALHQQRVSGVDFDVAVVTNLTQDHLDYHGGMDEYRRCKGLLFERLRSDAVAVLNRDREEYDYFAEVNAGRLAAYSMKGNPDADYQGVLLRMDAGGLAFQFRAPQGAVDIQTHLVGRYNLENMLAAATASAALGVEPDVIRRGLEKVRGVPGRLQRIGGQAEFAVVVDYAHTPDALDNVLRTVREFTPGRVLCVFGCGGDRDRTKRPKMGRVVEELADLPILTSDNPRSEEPQAILDEILAGIRNPKRCHVEADRAEAIRHAIAAARHGDTVVIAGKGHETYQILKDKVIPFDDGEIAAEALRRRG